MTIYQIPFNHPGFEGKEQEYILQALQNGHISGDGPFTKACHRYLEQLLNVPKVLLTTSCTHALEMAAILLGLQPGDEVIVPSFTFVSTVNAFVLHGARPVFIDIRADTLNLDERQLDRHITERTRAVIPVHYASVGCEMDVIQTVCEKYGIQIIEDNAHGLFGKYKGKYLGSFGCLAAQSFHETKNVTCGEGGALIINDVQYIERAEIIREKGTNRSRFFRGQVDKYTWVDIGSSYLPSDILAAFLLAQLEVHVRIQAKRKRIWEYYYQQLKDWAIDFNIRLPDIPDYCEQSFHLFYLIMPSMELRQALIAHLKEQGILGVFHYLPLHISDMGRSFGGRPGDCPITEEISDKLIRLPFYTSLTESDQAKVVKAIKEFGIRIRDWK